MYICIYLLYTDALSFDRQSLSENTLAAGQPALMGNAPSQIAAWLNESQAKRSKDQGRTASSEPLLG